MDVPTLILAPALVAIVLFAVVAVARLLRTWRAGAGVERVRVEDRDLIALEDEKHRLLVTLQDLELEHQLGKIDDSDYEGLRAFYEQEAVRVIRALEARA